MYNAFIMTPHVTLSWSHKMAACNSATYIRRLTFGDLHSAYFYLWWPGRFCQTTNLCCCTTPGSGSACLACLDPDPALRPAQPLGAVVHPEEDRGGGDGSGQDGGEAAVESSVAAQSRQPAPALQPRLHCVERVEDGIGSQARAAARRQGGGQTGGLLGQLCSV